MLIDMTPQDYISALERKLNMFKREYEVAFEKRDVGAISLAESRIEETAYFLSVFKKSVAFDAISDLQGEFNCGSEYRDFYYDTADIIQKYQRGESND